MVYMGGKFRIRKHLLPILQKEADKAEGYLEPFCGGCNVIEKICQKNRVAADRNKWLIEFWKSLDKLDDLPRELSREEYSKTRDRYNKGEVNWYISAVGFLGSFGGRFYDGGFGDGVWEGRINNVRNQLEGLKGVEFICRDYKDTPDLRNWVIYCDPPYQGVKGYREGLVYDEFWTWCKEMSKKNIVFISEMNCPIGEVVWEKEVKRTIGEERPTAVEKLFRIK